MSALPRHLREAGWLAHGPHSASAQPLLIRCRTSFRITAPSGGSVRLSECGRPCAAISSVLMPPSLPTLLPRVHGGVAVEQLGVVAGGRHADAIVVPRDRRPVQHGDQAVVGIGGLANEGNDTRLVIVAVNPLETGAVEVAFVQATARRGTGGSDPRRIAAARREAAARRATTRASRHGSTPAIVRTRCP